MRRPYRLLLVSLLGFYFVPNPGLCAGPDVTGLTPILPSLSYVASPGSTAIQTDNSEFIIASGTGSASPAIGVSGSTFAPGCGNVTWLTATLSGTTITAGNGIGMTITVNPTCISGAVSGQITVYAGSAVALISVSLYTLSDAPQISLLTPNSASAGGPEFTLTVDGSGFVNGSSTLEWNGSLIPTSFVSATQVTALIPASLIASESVAIVGVNNTAAGANGISNPISFSVFPPGPMISSLGPNYANAGGGAFTLFVFGSGFVNLGSTVEWNGSPVSTFYVSTTELVATIPANLIAAAGSASITVLNSRIGTSPAATFSINPSGSAITGLTVAPTSVLYEVLSGSTAVQTTTALVTSTGTGSGNFEIAVGVTGGTTNGYCPQLNWLTATLTNDPAYTIAVGGTATVTISVNPTCVSGAFSGQVTIYAGSASVSIPVLLYAYAGTGAATISSVGPNSVTAGGSPFSLIVNSAGFVSGQTTLEWNGSPVPTTFISANQLSASISASLIASEGSAWVTAFNPLTGASNAAYFSIMPPGSGITGLTAVPAAVTYKALSGSTKIQTDTSPLIVASGSGSANLAVSVSSPTLNVTCGTTTAPWLAATLASGAINAGGTAGVTISVNPCGGNQNLTGQVTVSGGSYSTSIAVTLNFLRPVFAAEELNINREPVMPISETAGTPPTNYTIGFTVTNDANPAQGSSFQLMPSIDNTSNSANWLSATANGDASDFTLTVDATNLIPGDYAGSVTAAGNSASSGTFQQNINVTLEVLTPVTVISSLSPASAAAGSAGFTLTVNGAGFVNGSTVGWNGTALTTTFISTTQLTATVPASLLAAAGTPSVNVALAGASPSNTVQFTIGTAPPAITGLSPNAVTAGSPVFTLTVTGTGFVSGGSTIEWNGTPLTTGFTSATQLTASVAASLIASAGSAIVTVLNSGTSPSNAATLTINPLVPAISGLTPASTMAGGPAFTLTVNGSDFVPGSNVEWNGSLVATSYVSASQLVASIPANLIAIQTGASVTVQNTGGATSGAVTFAITSAGPSLLTISHIADGNGWRSSVILVNTDTNPANYTISFHNDAGMVYTPPLALGTTTGTIPVGGSTIIETADTSSTLSEGWAQVSSGQSIGGSAIFRYDPWTQEAAVPLLTNGAIKLEVPYQIGNNLTLGIALANPSTTQTATITEIIRDQNGNALATRTFTLPPLSHMALTPTIPNGISGGGVVEYDSSVNIYALGIRSAPEASGLAFTSLDAVLLEPAATQTISHIADGDGWRSTIILVNTSTVAAVYTVNFLNDAGAAYAPPLALGNTSGSIPPGGSTIIETADTSTTLSQGWAQVTCAQTLGGTAIFRYDPWTQEAAVPLLTIGGVTVKIPYQTGSGLSLGVALANPSATQTANLTETIRDQNGNELSIRTFTLGALQHTAFNPAFPGNTTGGGVVEYDSDLNIYALGIRSSPEVTGLSFTSVRAAYQ